VRRRTTTVEYTRRREYERPAAHAQHPRAAIDGPADDGLHALVDTVPRAARDRGDDDEVGFVGERQIIFDVDREPDVAADRAGVRRQDAEVEVLDAVIAAVEPERLARETELETARTRAGR
jgi:hypothetical protein